MVKFSQDAYLDSLARKFYSQGAGAAGNSAAPASPAFSSLLGDGTSDLAPTRPKTREDKTPTNPVGHVMDFLLRPGYAVGQTIREAKTAGEDGFDLADFVKTFNPINAAQNLIVNDKELPSEPLLENWQPNQDYERGSDLNSPNMKAAASLALDVAFDPLSYVPGAAFVKAGQGIKKATGLSKLAQPGATVPRRAKPGVVDETVEQAPSEPELTGIGNNRIPESRQITAGPQALAGAPSSSSAPRTFEMGNTPAPDAPPRTFAMELAKADPKAASAAAKITDGTFVAPRTPEIAAELNMARTAEGIEEPKKVLRNVKSGEVVPFSQRLVNLTAARKQYPDLDIPTPFKEVPSPAAVVDEVPAQAPEVVSAPTRPEPKDWAKQNADREVTISKGKIAWLNADEITDPKVLAAAALSKEAKGLTLKEVLRNPKFKAQVEALYRADTAPQTIAPKPTAKGTKAARSAATEAARHVSEATTPKVARLTGDEWEAFKADLKTKVEAADYTRLLAQKKPESFEKVVAELKTRKIRTPIYVEEVIDITPEKIAADVAESIPEGAIVSKRTSPKRKPQAIKDQAAINAAKTNLPTAGERIPNVELPAPNIAAGEALTPEATNALARAIDGQQWAGVKDDFQFRSPIQEALKNKKQVGEGQAIHRNAANVDFQGNLFRGLINQFSAQVPEGMTGLNRADWLYQNMMPSMRAAEDFLRANGIMPIGSVGKEGYPITLSEVIDGLWKFTPGRDFVKGRIFTANGVQRGVKNTPGTVDPTALLGAAHIVAEQLGKSVSISDAVSLRDELNKIIKPGEFRNNVEEAVKGRRGITSNGHPVGDEAATAVTRQASDLFMRQEFVAHMFDAVMENTARYGAKFNMEVKQLSASSIRNVVEILRNPLMSPATAMAAITNPDDIVEIVAKTEVKPDLLASTDAAKEVTRDSMTDAVSLDDVTSATNRTKVSEKVTSGTREEVKEAAAKTYKDDVASAFSQAPATLLLNISDSTDLAMQAGILKKMTPLMTRFNPAWGNATLHQAITTGGSVAKLLQKQWRHEIAQMDKEFSKEQYGNAIKWLQGGQDVNIAPTEFRDAVIRLKPVFDQIFESDRVTGTAGVLSAFGREGFDIRHINEKLKFVYRDTDIAFPQFKPKTRTKKVWVRKQDGSRYQKNIVEEYYDAETFAQWREWDMGKDPLDFMARMETAFAGLATDMAVAQEGFRIASSLGYASKSRRAGMVQVSDQELSTIGRYMPKGAWFDPDILSEIKRMDEILAETTTLNSGFGRMINQYLDPILNMWKSGMTVWRPGHHVRNFIGDSMLSYYAHGVSNPEYYRKAMLMQSLRGEYDGWSALRALQGINRAPSGNAARRADIKVKVGRKGIAVSDRDIHQGLMDRGVLPDFRVQEDLLESGTNPNIAKLQAAMAITGGRAKQVVGRVSEARDDTVRIAHALHLLENGVAANPRLNKAGSSFKSLDDALDQVAAAVRKHHPDGADLTGFERNTMRRLMPFYSWSRKAFPLIAESLLTQPGRVTVFPKATAAYAEAQGIDMESLSNPFPDDQLFPSFIEDRSTGPVYKTDDGKYLGIAPGAPAMDILDDFVGDPKAGFMGMLNPFLKAPAELATGHSIANGSQIHDVGEYIDSQIPGVSTASSISGYSTMGSIPSILSGNGLDPQYQVEKGNKGHFDREGIVNYLLGVGVQNYSKQSYINYAEMEERDKKAALLEKLRGQ